MFFYFLFSRVFQGAIAITDIPGYAEARSRLLPLGFKLAHAPEPQLRELEDPVSLYNAGWSKGKEKIGNVPDELKGSFYANPICDKVGLYQKEHPYFYPDNIWPKFMPELEPSFKTAGKIMYESFVEALFDLFFHLCYEKRYDTVLLLAGQIDALCESKIPT